MANEIIDKKAVLAQLAEIEKGLNVVLPEVNKAVAAFPQVASLKDHQATLTDLANQVAKAKSIYQG